jgi:hypothetical protein
VEKGVALTDRNSLSMKNVLFANSTLLPEMVEVYIFLEFYSVEANKRFEEGN